MTLRLKGSNSGDVSLKAPATAGDNTITLPTSNGSAEQFLKNSGTAGELEFSSMVETSTGVGIGTTAPAGLLSLHKSGNSANYINLTNGATGDSSWSNGMLLGPNSSGDALVWQNENLALRFGTNNTDRMRILGNGRVAVGSDSALTRLHLDGTDNDVDNVLLLTAANLAAGAGGKIAFGGNYDGTNRTSWADIKGSKESGTSGEYGGYLSLSTRPGGGSNTERIRITSGGVVAVNRTTALHGGVFVLDYTNGTSAGLAIKDTQTSGTGVVLHVVNGSGTVVGGISQNQSTTSFNQNSDYRLKENVVDIADGITRVKQLQPKRFNFIADNTTTVDGFIAHEAQTVVPEAVTGTHNQVDDDNNPVYQGIDQSKLVPLLTAALQEAIGKIETLETQNTAQQTQIDDLLARVTALEAA